MICRTFLFLAGLISLGWLTACGPKETAANATPPTADATSPAEAPAGAKDDGPSFDPDKGLYLPADTRQSMGITTASAQKKTFQAGQAMKFQVFREANEAPLPGMSYRAGYAYASTILTEPEPGLELGQTGEVLGKTDFQKSATAKLFQINTLPNSNQTELLVEIADPQHELSLADFCSVRWQMAAVDAPVAVPDSALLKTTEGEFVYLLKADRFVRTEVKSGATGEGFTEVHEGVAAGDIVVTNPVQTLWLTELKLKAGGSE